MADNRAHLLLMEPGNKIAMKKRKVNKEVERKKPYNLLGDLPDRSMKISGSKIAEKERESYILEKLILDLNGIEPVPAYFVYPKKHKG